MFVEWHAGLEKVVENIQDKIPKIEWDFEGIHYFDNGPLTVQYLFVLDTLNFCFWPGISFFFAWEPCKFVTSLLCMSVFWLLLLHCSGD
jgi:hypothetical protein